MIKNRCIVIGIALLTIGGEAYSSDKKSSLHDALHMKRKIVILTSLGGGGHLAASNALESYLHNDYDVHVTHVFKELLKPLDPFTFLTLGRYSGEELYNLFVPGKHFAFLGWFYSLGVWYIQLHKERIHTLLRNYFLETKPDLIISVIPILDNIILDVAQELNIPFLLIPTDLNVSSYIINISDPTYKQFYIGLPFDDKEIITPLINAPISRDHIFTIGAPLRNAFFNKKNKYPVFRKKYAFDENKFTIMLLMGTQGSSEIEKYVTELLKISEPIHIIACIGKNEDSRQKLLNLSVPSHISLSVVGFTHNIADYMAVSDLLISKSGTLSVCEALYSNLPIFLDATSALLPWEKFNHYFIKKHEFGNTIDNYEDIVPLVTAIIENKNQLKTYKNNIQQLKKKNCPQEVGKLIKQIFKQKIRTPR